MRVFFVADLNAQGELREITEYDYATLERIPGAADLICRCATELWRNADEIEIALSDEKRTLLRWRSTAASAGVVTVRRSDGGLVSLTLLAAGCDPKADSTTLEVLQKHLVRELLQTPFEPAFDLMQIEKRPLAATITFASSPDDPEQMIQALADRCFAAAYFRFLGLA